MKGKYIYEVQDRSTGKIVCTGTAVRCANALGVCRETILRWGNGTRKSPQYDARMIDMAFSQAEAERVDYPDQFRQAIRAWDEFCEPLRKKYGVKVKRWDPKKEAGHGNTDL